MEGDDDRRLDAAVSLGIITAEQAQAIRDLVPARAMARAPVAFTAATLGYVLGALAVLIAMAWFLGDRWEWLGPGGVIAVSVLYAGLFLVVARRLRHEGFDQAAGIGVFLAVAMTPVAMVALLELVQWIPEVPYTACQYPEFAFWTCRGNEVLVELTTVAAALVALRSTRFSLLVLPVALVLLRAVFHAADVLGRAGWGAASAGWVWVAASGVMVLLAYETSRRQRGDADFALWLHLTAAMAAATASVMLTNQVEWYRHLLVPAAFVAFAFSLRMRRAPWTLLGLGWFVAYLGWLAGEVFRDTPFFPIVLAALGIGVIILTVWIQRNSERLVVRFGGLASDGRPSFPGAPWLMLVPLLVTALQLPAARALDHETWRAAQARPHRTTTRPPRGEAAQPAAPPAEAETGGHSHT